MFQLGDVVRKKTGYQWPGIVVSVFTTLGGNTRVVVECIEPAVAGALHIFNCEQLEKEPEPWPSRYRGAIRLSKILTTARAPSTKSAS